MLFAAPTIVLSSSGSTAPGLGYLFRRYDVMVTPQTLVPVDAKALALNWVPFKPPVPAEAGVELEYAVTMSYLESLMRFIDSSTLVTSLELGNKAPSCPVLTSPDVSRPLSITVGCAEMLTIPAGDMDMP